MGTKKIPIKVASDILKKYDQSQVIIVTYEKDTGKCHVVTYGKSLDDCIQAAHGGNFVKRALGWPEEMCHDKPARQIKKELNNERDKV